MFNKVGLKKALSDNYPLIGILVGTALVSLSIGLYQNPDTDWEYKAASGVIMWGMPYVEVKGSLINQPPLGFYTEALFLRTFGLSMETGVVLVTLFGLGCTILMYKIGKTLYGKQTGLFASALFALTPWELILSRSFLIDTQCLFFSLFCLYIGILAIRNDSLKLLVISGLLFAIALFTKLYAAFILIPLLLFYLYHQPKKLKRLPIQLAVFCMPVIFSALLWYSVLFFMVPSYLPRGLEYMFQHSDFSDFNAEGVVPSYFFVSTFLLNYGLGYFFVAATILSLIVGLGFRNNLRKQRYIDLIFLVPMLFILGLNMYLGVTLNLKVPYTSAVKYSYQTLPFFSLLAASLAAKCVSLFNSAKSNSKFKKSTFIIIGIIGIFLLVALVLANMYSAHQLSMNGFVIFQVELGKSLGYSFDNFHTISQNSPMMYVQYLGFGLVLSGLLWSCRHFIIDSFRPMRRWITEKNKQGNI
jgi:4-amino-4-deoxy-L-arabinose transferase-like glycosyltransferase